MTAERVANDLRDSGVSIESSFFSTSEIADACRDFKSLHESGVFQRAGIGHGPRHKMHTTVRTDETLWLKRGGADSVQSRLLDKFQDLQSALNRTLFLGLSDFEGHYASYDKGGFYRRHLDAFDSSSRVENSRVVSLVMYLNEHWKPTDGGMLRIYRDNECEPHIDVAPTAGTLVCFLSREVEHEVLASHAPRKSLSGWFRRRQ